MTRRALRRLLDAHVSPAFPDLVAWQDGLARWDGDPVLRGLHFARGGANADGLRVHAFAQPLFIPEEELVLAVSKHLDDVFLRDGPEADVMERVRTRAEEEGRAFLDRTSTCADLAANVLDLQGDSMGASLAEEIRGCCLAWTGDDADADAALERAAERLAGSTVAWDVAARERIGELRVALGSGPAETLAVLGGRVRGTCSALGLGAP